MYEVVVNPAGASGRTLHAWHKAEEVFKKNRESYHVYYSSIDHDINDICSDLTSENKDTRLVIVGGDGSMNRAVNGIHDFSKVELGFIPCGSGNDLAKALKIKKDPVQCAETIIQNVQRRTLDIGKVTYLNSFSHLKDTKENTFSRLFNISCGIGFDAHICQQVAVSRWKKPLNRLHIGKIIYGAVALRVIAGTKMVPAEFIFDDQKMKFQKMLLSVAMNEPYEGGGFAFCPKAQGNDGLLDYCIGDSLSTFDVLRIFPYAAGGNHVKFRGVYTGTFKKAEIITSVPLWVHQDGEVECKSSHITIELHNQKLHMLN